MAPQDVDLQRIARALEKLAESPFGTLSNLEHTIGALAGEVKALTKAVEKLSGSSAVAGEVAER